MLSPSSGLPPPSRVPSSVYRPRYEAMMSKLIPGALALSSFYFLSAGWEFVLVPWLGRQSWSLRVLFSIACALLALAWGAYYLARTSDAGSVPPELGEHMRLMPREARTAENYCTKCENVKPPRAHHCKRCKKCTLRMDHHCVALGNCVGLYNWKFFISAWFYMFLSGVYGLLLVVVRYLAHPEFDSSEGSYERMHVVLFTLGVGFLTLTAYKHANMHINLALLNLSSLEYMSLPAYISLNFCQRYGIAWSRISNFDKGWRGNLMQLMGEPVITWFMPWVTPRSPWGPHPVTWYSGYSVRDLYGPASATPRSGNQVNAHNHETSARNPWNMFDEPVQHAAEGLRASNLGGKGSMPLIAYQEEDGTMHHGDREAHSHGGPSEPHAHDHDGNVLEHNHGGGGGGGGHNHGGQGGHNHSHGGAGGHNHSHGDDDDMPGLLSDEELQGMHHGHSHAGGGGGGGHNHSHGGGGGGGHNHSH